MKILKTIGILAIAIALLIGSAGSTFAKGPPDPHPGVGNPSSGKQGLFGTVVSTETITPDEEYILNLETKKYEEDVAVTINDATTYKVPRVTKGPKANLETFLGIIGNIDDLVGERVAVLGNSDFEALKLMLIPSGPPLHAHRVGIVSAFTPYIPDGEGTNGSIEITDKDGVIHTFDIKVDTVYRPSAEDGGISELSGEALIEELMGRCVTVVTTGDPKQLDPEPDPAPDAKAVVLHEEMPDWAGGKIRIEKVITGDDPPEESFEFEAFGSLFSLDAEDDHYNSGWLVPDTYVITEDIAALGTGWTLDDISIVETETSAGTLEDVGSGTATIVLNAGEMVTVTFTNDYEELP